MLRSPSGTLLPQRYPTNASQPRHRRRLKRSSSVPHFQPQPWKSVRFGDSQAQRIRNSRERSQQRRNQAQSRFNYEREAKQYQDRVAHTQYSQFRELPQQYHREEKISLSTSHHHHHQQQQQQQQQQRHQQQQQQQQQQHHLLDQPAPLDFYLKEGSGSRNYIKSPHMLASSREQLQQQQQQQQQQYQYHQLERQQRLQRTQSASQLARPIVYYGNNRNGDQAARQEAWDNTMTNMTTGRQERRILRHNARSLATPPQDFDPQAGRMTSKQSNDARKALEQANWRPKRTGRPGSASYYFAPPRKKQPIGYRSVYAMSYERNNDYTDIPIDQLLRESRAKGRAPSGLGYGRCHDNFFDYVHRPFTAAPWDNRDRIRQHV